MNKHSKFLRLLVAFAVCLGVGTSLARAGDSGALWLPHLLEEDGVLPTYGASMAVDPQGGIHVSYCIYAGADQGLRPALYAYCPKDPGNKANWRFVQLGDHVQDARLALDGKGRPRLMLFGWVEDPELGTLRRYQYAECNRDWTDPANWTVTTITTHYETVATREEDSNRYFAISPQGTVGLIHTKRLENGQESAFYRSCSGDCTNPNNWTETMITSSYIDQPSLTYTPDGHPRLLFGLFQDGDLYLAYAQCDGDAADPSQWFGLVLSKIHGTARYCVQTDAQGRPRVAFSSGSYAAAPFTDHQLFYLWCNEGSPMDLGNWHFNNVGIYFSAGGVDLALDAQGRPRISCESSAGLVYAWSNGNAESDDPGWQQRTVESNAALAADYDLFPIHKCTLSNWSNGQRSCLALDPAGNPRFGYDAQHTWSGAYTDHPWDNCYIKDVTVTRLAYVNLNPSLSVRKHAPDALEIVFENGALESASSLSGPWQPVAAATSPLVVPFNGQSKFYRIRP